ncbi:MAG TPA: radical SAM protein [Pyrinomonadaceae bacterium]|nr:radical SAM protein [Pyrinomonadaceae bacterium]
MEIAPMLSRVEGLNVLLVNQCNLHCLSCSYPSQQRLNRVRRETLRSVVEKLLPYGLSRVTLSGGEPTMHPEFCEIVEDLHDAGLEITLVTNGTYLRKHFERIRNRLQRCIISLDGDTPELYQSIRGANAFDELMSAARLFLSRSRRTHMTFCAVVQRKNFRRLPRFIDLAREVGVHRFSFLCPDLPSLIEPGLRNSGAFGHDAPASPETLESIILTLEEIEEMRAVTIPAVRRKVAEYPEYGNKTIDMLTDFANYFESFRLGKPRPEYRRCGLPFSEVVLDDEERLRFCFFMPDRWAYTPDIDPLNHAAAVRARRDYLESDRRCHEFCNACLQAMRLPADVVRPAAPPVGVPAFDPSVPDRALVRLTYERP